jgi:glutaredoxin-related protein
MEDVLRTLKTSEKIVILKVNGCYKCKLLNDWFDSINLVGTYENINLSDMEDIDEYVRLIDHLHTKMGCSKMFPMCFVRGEYIGSYEQVLNKHQYGDLQQILKNKLYIVLNDDF